MRPTTEISKVIRAADRAARRCGLLMTVALTGMVFAQEPQAIEEIVVTAGKAGEEGMQKAPYNVSAISAQQIAHTGSESLDDLTKLVPGLEVFGSNGDQQVIIRGLAATAGEPQVATYLDETPLSGGDEIAMQQSYLPLYDMQRVEVLRGPQGTLYGADSEGGAVRYITNKPELYQIESAVDALAGARTWGGGFDSRANAFANLPIVEGVIGARAVGYVQHVDGLQDRPGLKLRHTDSQDRYGGRFAVEWDGSRTKQLLASVMYQENKADDRSYVVPSTESTTGTVLTPFFDKLSIASLTATQQFAWGVLTGTAAYTDREARNVTDATLTPFFPGRSTLLQNSSRTMIRFAEVRLATSQAVPIHAVAGLYYQDRKVNIDTLGLFASSQTGEIESSNRWYDHVADYYFRSTAAFVNVAYATTGKLSLEGGVRQYGESQEQHNDLIVSPFGTLGPSDASAQANGHVARGRAAYAFTKDAIVYLLFSEGFRPGGPNRRTLDASFPDQYLPDQVKNYELGAKTEWFKRALALNGSVYFMNWDDIQVLEANSVGVSYIGNAGRAALKGIEIEGTERPTNIPGLAINFAFRLSQQKLTQNSPSYDALKSPYSGADGDTILRSSHDGWNFGLEQHFGVFKLPAYVRADLTYTGRAATTFSSADPANRSYGGYALGNLRFALEGLSWKVVLYARNIGNKRTNATGWYQNIAGAYDLIYQPSPCEIGTEVGYHF